MRSLNALRAVVLSFGAAYSIFNQDHSVAVGKLILSVVTIALVIGSILIHSIPKLKVSRNDIFAPSIIALAVALLSLVFVAEQDLFQFKALVILFVVAMAVLELVLSTKAESGDKIELRISAALGVLTGLLFLVAPLNDLNAVGFLSAYFAISAVQRAVWAAGPSKGKKSANGKN
jgi:uncharacterized membrane protein HdeD (DUF308 family)